MLCVPIKSIFKKKCLFYVKLEFLHLVEGPVWEMEIEKDRKEQITRWNLSLWPLDHKVCTLRLCCSLCPAKAENERRFKKPHVSRFKLTISWPRAMHSTTWIQPQHLSHLITMNTHFIIAAAVLPKFVSRSLLHSGLYSSFINDRKCFNVKEPVSLMQFLIFNQGSVKFR